MISAFPRSPLRYPGGKSRAVRAILSLIPETETRLYSPFLGGGSVELVASTRMEVSAGDIFVPLVDFWKELLEDPAELARTIELYYPLERGKFYLLQRVFYSVKDRHTRAAIFFVLNRSSFSGITLSGGMSPGHPRFTPSAIERVRRFTVDRGRFSVSLLDFRTGIPAHPESFIYADPPYLNGQGLYGTKGDTHRGFDHLALYELLSKRDRWILSYNDCEEIRDLYRGFPIRPVSWLYGMGNNKHSREIIITSKEIT